MPQPTLMPRSLRSTMVTVFDLACAKCSILFRSLQTLGTRESRLNIHEFRFNKIMVYELNVQSYFVLPKFKGQENLD